MSALSEGSDSIGNWRIPGWYPSLDLRTQSQLKAYFDELIKFNKVVNLVSAKTIQSADAVHFADSLLASQIVRKKVNKSDSLYDIGSGNGFPGLVYSILYPDQKVVLVDSDERKCEFLKHVAGALGITNVEVQTKQVESFDIGVISQAICRGFAPLPRALLALRKAVKDKGQVFHLKADEWGMEVSQIPIQLCSAWQPVLDGEYSLPVGGTKLFVIRTDKMGIG